MPGLQPLARAVPVRLVFCLFLISLLAACEGSRSEFSRLDQEDIFLPPSPAATRTPTRQPTGGTPGPRVAAGETDAPETPQTTPTCTNLLTFVEDQTIPDGTVAGPGQQLDKRWLVENSGTCNWEAGYSLRRIVGPDLGAPELGALFPARSGARATLQLILTAPTETGIYRSAWQAYDPAGQPFGEPVYIEFSVVPPEPTPAP